MKHFLLIHFLILLISSLKSQTAVDSFNAIPFRLERFYAEEKLNKIEVHFAIAETFNVVERYELWSSNDNEAFSFLKSIPRQMVRPSSISYMLTDSININSGSKNVYYKLRQVVDGGLFLESHIISLKLQNKVLQSVQTWPNPVTNKVNITVSSENKDVLNISLYNSIGVLVKSITKNALAKNKQTEQMSLEGLTNGTYFIRIVANDKLIGTKKIIKQ